MGALLSAGPVAEAAKKKKKDQATTTVEPLQVSPDRSTAPIIKDLSRPLPMDTGALPAGLANGSAQGCYGCHFESHAEWETSGHARGHASPAFQAAAEQVGSPACWSCHLPLAVQHDQLVTYDQEDIHEPVFAPNPNWDPTLRSEGVTCAACHIRDGMVVGTQGSSGPHLTAIGPELAKAESCAGCHQLTWPGATTAFYNTYGEWKESAYHELGITCQDCHMGPGPGRSAAGSNHSFNLDRKRAVSVLVDLDTAALVRGGPALDVTLRVQNTGAGHAFPTGSPYSHVALTAALVGPFQEREGAQATSEASFTAMFGRTISDAPPWDIVDDTTLKPGGERAFSFSLPLRHSAPAGEWALQVTLRRVIRGTSEEPFLTRTIPLNAD